MDVIAILAIVFAIVSAAAKSGNKNKNRNRNRQGASPRPRDQQDKLDAFLDAVVEAKIPDRALEAIPFLKADSHPAVEMARKEATSHESTEGEACDIPHSLQDPRLPLETSEGTACDIPHSLLDPRLAQEQEAAPAQQRSSVVPSRAASVPARAFSARDMRQAVITSEILARPVSLRNRRI